MKQITLYKESTASFDVDSQTGFTPLHPEQLPVPDGHTIGNALNEQAKYARLRIMSKDAHPPHPIWLASNKTPQFTKIENEKNVDLYWKMHCCVGLPGFELLPELPHPSEYNFLIYKGVENDMHPYTACYHDQEKKISTGVIEYLSSQKIKTILIGGLALDYCVKDTAIDLINVGFRVIINISATKAINDKLDLKEMENLKIIFINNIDELKLL